MRALAGVVLAVILSTVSAGEEKGSGAKTVAASTFSYSWLHEPPEPELIDEGNARPSSYDLLFNGDIHKFGNAYCFDLRPSSCSIIACSAHGCSSSTGWVCFQMPKKRVRG